MTQAPITPPLALTVEPSVCALTLLERGPLESHIMALRIHLLCGGSLKLHMEVMHDRRDVM